MSIFYLNDDKNKNSINLFKLIIDVKSPIKSFSANTLKRIQNIYIKMDGFNFLELPNFFSNNNLIKIHYPPENIFT